MAVLDVAEVPCINVTDTRSLILKGVGRFSKRGIARRRQKTKWEEVFKEVQNHGGDACLVAHLAARAVVQQCSAHVALQDIRGGIKVELLEQKRVLGVIAGA